MPVFPQATPQLLGSSDVLRVLFVGVLVFPLAWTIVGLTLGAIAHPQDVETTLNMALQTLFAKHFGASIVTLPVLLLVTEQHSWIKPTRQRDWMMPFLAVTIVLACLSALWRGFRGDEGSSVAGSILEYRLLLTAVLAWAVMRLSPRVSMPLLAAAMLALVFSVAATIDSLAQADGVFRLFLLAIELMVMQALLLVLYVVARNARRMHEQLTREAMTDTLTGLQNLKALRMKAWHARTHRSPASDRELGYLLLDNIEGILGGLGLKAYAALMTAVSVRLESMADVYYLTSAQFVLQRIDAGEGVVKWRKIVEQLERFEFSWEGSATGSHPISALRGCARTTTKASTRRSSRRCRPPCRRVHSARPSR